MDYQISELSLGAFCFQAQELLQSGFYFSENPSEYPYTDSRYNAIMTDKPTTKKQTAKEPVHVSRFPTLGELAFDLQANILNGYTLNTETINYPYLDTQYTAMLEKIQESKIKKEKKVV
jgi:hypothetical protein